MSDITLYSDGGGQKGSAAAGACILQDSDGRRVHLAVFLGPGTNNEAEISAGLLGYSFLSLVGDVTSVRWVCDSEYVLKSACDYIHNWQRNGWRTASKQPVKNQGLWRTFLALRGTIRITSEHVRGHTGHPENEACDTASTWVQQFAASYLDHSEDDFIRFEAGGHAAGANWLLVDGRPFIESLRSDGEIHPTKEDSFRLAEILSEAGCVSFEESSHGPSAITLDSEAGSGKGPEAELKAVIRGLKSALNKAKKVSGGNAVADDLLSEISEVIEKYQ